MIAELQGSELTKAILESVSNYVWCAVSNISDDYAIATIDNGYYELLVPIVAFDNVQFVCDKGDLWQYAVSVKRVELTHNDAVL
ncbi:MAG: hypothetical protein ACTH6Z_07545 [Psychrobacter sp.]